jgi:hypothetical protein
VLNIKFKFFYQSLFEIIMYKKSTKDPIAAAITAALGAGTVACFSVSRGQNLFVGLGITVFATVLALVVDRWFDA